MENQLAIAAPDIKGQLQKLDKIKEIREELLALSHKHGGLKINGIEDKDGWIKVDSARKELKAKRVEIEKDCKMIRDEFNKLPKYVREVELDLLKIISPLEEDFIAQQQAIEVEKERIREAEQRKKVERINSMRADLISAGFYFNGINYSVGDALIDNFQIETISDERFSKLLEFGKSEHIRIEAEKEEVQRRQKEEQERLAKIAAEQEAERERLNQIRLEQERKEREIREEQERIEAEKLAIIEVKEREERERLHRMEVEKAAEKARQTALKEAEEAAKREALLKEEAKRQAELERQRQESLRPDKEKLTSFAESLLNIALPECSQPDAIKIVGEIRADISRLKANIIGRAAAL